MQKRTKQGNVLTYWGLFLKRSMYDLGVISYLFLKHLVKYDESLKPTLKAISVIVPILFSKSWAAIFILMDNINSLIDIFVNVLILLNNCERLIFIDSLNWDTFQLVFNKLSLMQVEDNKEWFEEVEEQSVKKIILMTNDNKLWKLKAPLDY